MRRYTNLHLPYLMLQQPGGPNWNPHCNHYVYEFAWERASVSGTLSSYRSFILTQVRTYKSVLTKNKLNHIATTYILHLTVW